MKTVITLDELRAARAQLVAPVGLAPTMGYLHDGHLSLVRRAREECASVVVSIFVNPTQFGPAEDLSHYPRDVERDLELLEQTGADLVWTPTPEVMYPPGFQTWVTVEEVTRPLEGGMRPGHFRGVATVVAKLFNAVQPQRAYFGQKDAQQVAVIRRMTRDLDFNLQIVVCPTQREPDGLALSSRNIYLDPASRQAAPVLFRALRAARAAFDAGERDAGALRQIMQRTLAQESLANPQYVSCADPDSLEEIEGPIGGVGVEAEQRSPAPPALLSMAVFFGKTRLIDNLLIGESP